MNLSDILSMLNSWNQMPAWTQSGNDMNSRGQTPPDPNSALGQAGQNGGMISMIQNLLKNMPPQVFQNPSPPASQAPPAPQSQPAGPADNSALINVLQGQNASLDPAFQMPVPQLQQYPDNLQSNIAQQGAGQIAGQPPQTQKPPYVPMTFQPGMGGTANAFMGQQGFSTQPLSMYPQGGQGAGSQQGAGAWGDIWSTPSNPVTSASNPNPQNQQQTPNVGGK